MEKGYLATIIGAGALAASCDSQASQNRDALVQETTALIDTITRYRQEGKIGQSTRYMLGTGMAAAIGHDDVLVYANDAKIAIGAGLYDEAAQNLYMTFTTRPKDQSNDGKIALEIQNQIEALRKHLDEVITNTKKRSAGFQPGC